MFESLKHKRKVATIRKLRVIEDYFAEPNLIHQDTKRFIIVRENALKCLAELIEEYGNES